MQERTGEEEADREEREYDYLIKAAGNDDIVKRRRAKVRGGGERETFSSSPH